MYRVTHSCIEYMTDTYTTNNGVTPRVSASDTAAKRRMRNLPSLPSGASSQEMVDVSYACKVDSTPVTWEALPIYGVFSLSSDGSYPKMKVHKSKYCDLRTGKSESVGSGRCYKVVF